MVIIVFLGLINIFKLKWFVFLFYGCFLVSLDCLYGLRVLGLIIINIYIRYGILEFFICSKKLLY